MAKTYTREFKIEVCKLVIEEGIKVSIVAENFGVNNIILYRWLDEYKTYGNGSFVGKGCLKPEDAKFKQLEKENERLKQENEILKKAAAYFAKRKSQRLDFAIKTLKDCDTSIVCQVLKVSRSGLIKHKNKKETVKENELETAVVNCFKKHNGNYGRIRIHKELKRKGIHISEAKIARILREKGLVSRGGRKSKHKKPKKTPAEYISENLVKNKFEIREINKLWCADITELKVRHGKMYISGIIDVGSRKIVGWSIEQHARQEIVQRAIYMAYGRCKPEGLIYHCDRGCQYTANKTKSLLDKYKITSSMSRPGSPNDNQPIESFWKTLKQEILDVSKMKFREARKVIIEFIEMEYNSQRLHSALDYQSPNEVWEQQSA